MYSTATFIFLQSITALNYELLQMLSPPFVVLKPSLIRRLNLTKFTPESRLRPLRLLRQALAVTLPINVSLQHGFAGTFDLA